MKALSFILIAMAAVVAVSLVAVSLASATDVNGEQTGTWTMANSPYVVTGGIAVPSGRTLTIEPGVVARFYSTTPRRLRGRT